MKTPSASNNQFGIACSYPGLCSYCFTEIANFSGSFEVLANNKQGELCGTGIFRPRITSFKPNIRTCEFLLNDETKMLIVLCEECNDDIEPKNMANLMESEINGWQKECDELIHDWKPEMREAYMKSHSEKFIKDRITRKWNSKQLALLTKPDKKKLNIKFKEK